MGIRKESLILSPSLCLWLLVSGDWSDQIIFRDLSPETLNNVTGLNGQQWTPLTIRTNQANREFQIPLDAPVHSPITRVFIVDGAKRAEDINVTLTRTRFDGFAIYHAHDFFELFPLEHSRNNIQYELQLKKPLIDKFKAHDQVTKMSSLHDLQT